MWITFLQSCHTGNGVSDQCSNNKSDNKCDHYTDSNYCSCRELIIWSIPNAYKVTVALLNIFIMSYMKYQAKENSLIEYMEMLKVPTHFTKQ